MTASDNLSDRDMHRAELASSDEDVESLLSGGADISELIEAGVLDDDEPPLRDEEEKARLEAEAEAYISQPSDLSAEEIWAEHLRHEEWLEANGHKRRQRNDAEIRAGLRSLFKLSSPEDHK